MIENLNFLSFSAICRGKMGYDNLEEKVMTEAEYISISEGVLAFNESISSIFEDVLEKDKLQAAS